MNSVDIDCNIRRRLVSQKLDRLLGLGLGAASVRLLYVEILIVRLDTINKMQISRF